MSEPDKKSREGVQAPEETKAPPRDRDQSAISVVRAQDVADRAEFSPTTGAQSDPDQGETLISRDNMKGAPDRFSPTSAGNSAQGKPGSSVPGRSTSRKG